MLEPVGTHLDPGETMIAYIDAQPVATAGWPLIVSRVVIVVGQGANAGAAIAARMHTDARWNRVQARGAARS